MSTQPITEMLAAHADQLNRGEKIETDALIASLPGQREAVASLLNVAARLKRTLKPTALAPHARAHLRDGLVMAAQHKASQKILIERHESAWGWVLGAAALGSAAGLIAIAWRARGHRQPVSSAVQQSAQSN